jgi:hypothetical protein
LADARHLPHGRSRAGDRHLKFYETRDNLAQLLGGISVFKLDQLMRAGEIEAKVIGKRVVFDLDEVRRFAKELPSWEPKDPRFLLSATR